jgi:nucleoside-diphosphate-sugar epimerase
MRVFVTGGTGAVGPHTIPALVHEGHMVTAFARTPEKAAALTAQGATDVLVSLVDRAALAAFASRDAVINLASAIPPMRRWMTAKAWRNNDRVRTQGSAAVVDAALAARSVAWSRSRSACRTATSWWRQRDSLGLEHHPPGTGGALSL